MPAASIITDVFEKTGRVDSVSDLAELPESSGVKNVDGDLGQVIARSPVAESPVRAPPK